MKRLIRVALVALAALAALAVLSLSACGRMAQGEPQIANPNGPYDNTQNSLGGRYVGGGGGGGGGSGM
jgi:hypothetical protein